MSKPGVYIHIPFCSGKCYYCDFYSVFSDAETMNQYTDALCRHIIECDGIEADTVYFGGGTPSLIGADNLIRILESVRKSFRLSDGSQITLEANPGDICITPGRHGEEREALKILRNAGFDRISFGVQAAQDNILKALGRRHSIDDVYKAVGLSRECGFEDITLDLMYALPNQTMEEWNESISTVLSMNPTHISCYALKLEENVPLYACINSLPDDDEQLEMYLMLVNTLQKHGYEQYEISNFAKPGYKSKHNSKYWDGTEYYGFGPSAHSYVSNVRYAYENNLKAYICGEHRYKDYSILNETDMLEEYIMLSLRTTDGFSPDYLYERFRIDSSPAADVMKKYEPYGFTKFENGRYVLTPKGFFVSNSIIVEIYEALNI